MYIIEDWLFPFSLLASKQFDVASSKQHPNWRQVKTERQAGSSRSHLLVGAFVTPTHTPLLLRTCPLVSLSKVRVHRSAASP